MVGDASLFKRADMIEAGWAVIQPILDAWAARKGGNWIHTRLIPKNLGRTTI